MLIKLIIILDGLRRATSQKSPLKVPSGQLEVYRYSLYNAGYISQQNYYFVSGYQPFNTCFCSLFKFIQYRRVYNKLLYKFQTTESIKVKWTGSSVGSAGLQCLVSRLAFITNTLIDNNANQKNLLIFDRGINQLDTVLFSILQIDLYFTSTLSLYSLETNYFKNTFSFVVTAKCSQSCSLLKVGISYLFIAKNQLFQNEVVQLSIASVLSSQTFRLQNYKLYSVVAVIQRITSRSGFNVQLSFERINLGQILFINNSTISNRNVSIKIFSFFKLLCQFKTVLIRQAVDPFCLNCSMFCQICTPELKCLKCQPGYQYQQFNCIPICLQWCSYCLIQASCLNCQAGYQLLEDNSCKIACPIQCNRCILPYTCIACSEGCQQCLNQRVCVSCRKGLSLNGQKCLTGWNCAENCQECSQSETCLQCKDLYYLQKGNCRKCVKTKLIGERRFCNIQSKSLLKLQCYQQALMIKCRIGSVINNSSKIVLKLNQTRLQDFNITGNFVYFKPNMIDLIQINLTVQDQSSVISKNSYFNFKDLTINQLQQIAQVNRTTQAVVSKFKIVLSLLNYLGFVEFLKPFIKQISILVILRDLMTQIPPNYLEFINKFKSIQKFLNPQIVEQFMLQKMSLAKIEAKETQLILIIISLLVSLSIEIVIFLIKFLVFKYFTFKRRKRLGLEFINQILIVFNYLAFLANSQPYLTINLNLVFLLNFFLLIRRLRMKKIKSLKPLYNHLLILFQTAIISFMKDIRLFILTIVVFQTIFTNFKKLKTKIIIQKLLNHSFYLFLLTLQFVHFQTNTLMIFGWLMIGLNCLNFIFINVNTIKSLYTKIIRCIYNKNNNKSKTNKLRQIRSFRDVVTQISINKNNRVI